tara:strand:- start:416 stop:715 length:300 start_codon:yes stop_codon:yes gene_type:complete
MDMEWLDNWVCKCCRNKFLVPEDTSGVQIEGLHSKPKFCPFCGTEEIFGTEDFSDPEAEYITEDADGEEINTMKFDNLDDMMKWLRELGEDDDEEDESF